MEIGIDDDMILNDSAIYGDEDLESNEENIEKQYQSENDNHESQHDNDFVDLLLKSKGIEDKTKIKFENEEGDIEEINWNSLSNQERFNILSSSDEDPETALDESEIQLINLIRESGLTPEEYVQNLQDSTIKKYIQDNQEPDYQYQVDQFSDDELFVYDFISRMGDVTQEEALEALDKAKSNESLFNKQITAIRNEYKAAEQDNIKQSELEQEQLVQEQYNQFSNQVADKINELTEFSGYNLNMEDEDKQTLYDFITGFDGAGNNYFSKALADPEILVKAAWLILNGEQMVQDISEYYQNEITKVRKESYRKGLEDSKNQSKSNIVFKDKKLESHIDIYDDLD